MRVRRANKNDLPAISAICKQYGGMDLPPYYINKRDIAVVALDGPKIVGFIWCGLMCQNKLGYIDWFLADPAYSHKGVGAALGKEMTRVADKLGVEIIMGFIADGKHSDASKRNAGLIGMGTDGKDYDLVVGHVKIMQEYIGIDSK